MEFQHRILIVDDLAEGRDLLTALLEFNGYQTITASNGHQALELARTAAPGLILLDIMMPDLDGYDVCRQIRADPNLAEIPVVMVTTLDDRNSRMRGLEAGADDFVSKPLDRAELLARIRTITRLDRFRRLHAERKKFAWAIERSNDGYVSINAAGELYDMNHAARRYLNLSTDTHLLPHITLAELIDRNYRCHPANAWQDWPANMPTQPCYLVRPETPTSQAFWLELEVLDLPGAQPEHMIRLHDVTAQIAGARDMSAFHALIQHKLRTPLGSIVGSLDLLAQEAHQLPDEQLREFSHMASISAQRLKNEIDQILIYMDVLEEPQETLGLSLDEFWQLIGMTISDLQLGHVTVEIPEVWPAWDVPLSRHAADLILLSLLQNAKKFHPHQSPTITIRCTITPAQRLDVQIIDNGRWLAPDQLAQATRPYYQAEKYFTGQVPGMGVGLAIVAALLWNVDGSYTLANRTDCPGVQVEFSVPLTTSTLQYR